MSILDLYSNNDLNVIEELEDSIQNVIESGEDVYNISCRIINGIVNDGQVIDSKTAVNYKNKVLDVGINLEKLSSMVNELGAKMCFIEYSSIVEDLIYELSGVLHELNQKYIDMELPLNFYLDLADIMDDYLSKAVDCG